MIGMNRPLYRPNLHQSLWLAAIGLLALTGGFYLRYGLMQQASIGIACGANPSTWLCATRHTAYALYSVSAFGIAALGAALLNLIRPSFALCAVALIAGGIGVVLHNVALSALALALLIVSLARPAPEPS
jgi:hypothetical protein